MFLVINMGRQSAELKLVGYSPDTYYKPDLYEYYDPSENSNGELVALSTSSRSIRLWPTVALCVLIVFIFY